MGAGDRRFAMSRIGPSGDLRATRCGNGMSATGREHLFLTGKSSHWIVLAAETGANDRCTSHG